MSIYGHQTNCGEQSMVLNIYIHNPIYVELHNSYKKKHLLFKVKTRTVNQLHFFVTRVCLFECRNNAATSGIHNPVRQVTLATNCTVAPITCGVLSTTLSS
jgi:hypothetical protein